jgi:cell division protein YceG involved in septum cleavage
MRKLALAFVFVVVFVVGVPVLVGTILWTRITEKYKGYHTTEQFVTIPRGATAGDIRRRLVDAGVVENDLTMRAALVWSRQADKLKAGEYRFDRPLSATEVIDRLVRGEVYTERETVYVSGNR